MKDGNDPQNDEELRCFFPATRDEFNGKCGKVARVTAEDFADEHRRRHLKSFQKSWAEWMKYQPCGSPQDGTVAEKFAERLLERNPATESEFESMLIRLRREFHAAPGKSSILRALDKIGGIQGTALGRLLTRKSVRSHSGVVVITVLTSPGQFSCPNDCHYCPDEPGQPRSYLSTEPAVLRGNQNGWDASMQFWDRAETLHHNGHTIDKIECMVLGGTWSGYPRAYQEEFIRDLFYGANTLHEFMQVKVVDRGTEVISKAPDGMRPRLSLEEEQRINETAAAKIIGLTLETRPDKINLSEIRRLRRFGCTRVQIGVQHTSDDILNFVNRGCRNEHAIRAIRLLKDACFKVDIHLMPDLPSSTVYIDKAMFEQVLSSHDLQADQWKIYPCEVTPFSKIEEWYKNGDVNPYAEVDGGAWLHQLCVKVKHAVHPWIRLNRVVRDIPTPTIIGGNKDTNLRQIINSGMEKRDIHCRCLRCREVKLVEINISEAVLTIRRYASLGAEAEYFLSYETDDEAKVFGFLRLRISKEGEDNLVTKILPELKKAALVRELHVYGQLVGSEETKEAGDCRPQHTGFGRRLLAAAEIIATKIHGQRKIAVIAGVGTREYYRKFGYKEENLYMTKETNVSIAVKFASDVGLTGTLGVQDYDMTTDLGVITGPVNEVSKNNEEKAISSVNKRHKQQLNKNIDALAPLGGKENLVATKISRAIRISSVSMEEDESEQLSEKESRDLLWEIPCTLEPHNSLEEDKHYVPPEIVLLGFRNPLSDKAEKSSCATFRSLFGKTVESKKIARVAVAVAVVAVAFFIIRRKRR